MVCYWVEDAAGDYGVAVVRYTDAGDLDVGFGPDADGVSEWFDDGDRDRWGPIAIDANGDIVGACFGADSSDSLHRLGRPGALVGFVNTHR